MTLETRIYMVYGEDINSFQDIWHFSVLWDQNNPIGAWPTLHLINHNTLEKQLL